VLVADVVGEDDGDLVVKAARECGPLAPPHAGRP
jgi:hypothetical protein